MAVCVCVCVCVPELFIRSFPWQPTTEAWWTLFNKHTPTHTLPQQIILIYKSQVRLGRKHKTLNFLKGISGFLGVTWHCVRANRTWENLCFRYNTWLGLNNSFKVEAISDWRLKLAVTSWQSCLISDKMVFNEVKKIVDCPWMFHRVSLVGLCPISF